METTKIIEMTNDFISKLEGTLTELTKAAKELHVKYKQSSDKKQMSKDMKKITSYHKEAVEQMEYFKYVLNIITISDNFGKEETNKYMFLKRDVEALEQKEQKLNKIIEFFKEENPIAINKILNAADKVVEEHFKI